MGIIHERTHTHTLKTRTRAHNKTNICTLPPLLALCSPDVIYTGGQNNGASSGVLKSIDGGKHWVVASTGLFDTRIRSLGIGDGGVGDGSNHVLVGVPGAIYETTDGAETWAIVNESKRFGTCYSFKNGTIGNAPCASPPQLACGYTSV